MEFRELLPRFPPQYVSRTNNARIRALHGGRLLDTTEPAREVTLNSLDLQVSIQFRNFDASVDGYS